MPAVHTITVCLPSSTPTDQLATRAITAAQTAGFTAATTTPAGHFLTRARWKRSRLLQPWHNTAAGGPIRLLDLDAMQHAARTGNWERWHVWQQVVAGTRPAQPYWTFLSRHLADPKKYTLDQAQQQYQAQPRIATMHAYNLWPRKRMHLPTSHLEAFQTTADTYMHLGEYTAIPAHGLITRTGRLLSAASLRLSDLFAYLADAHAELRRLEGDDQLVALAVI